MHGRGNEGAAMNLAWIIVAVLAYYVAGYREEAWRRR